MEFLIYAGCDFRSTQMSLKMPTVKGYDLKKNKKYTHSLKASKSSAVKVYHISDMPGRNSCAGGPLSEHKPLFGEAENSLPLQVLATRHSENILLHNM